MFFIIHIFHDWKTPLMHGYQNYYYFFFCSRTKSFSSILSINFAKYLCTWDNLFEEQLGNILVKLRLLTPGDSNSTVGLHSTPNVSSVDNLRHTCKGDSTKASAVLLSILTCMLVNFTIKENRM